MNGWAIDSSFALALGLPDEATLRVERFVDRLSQGTPLWVPALFGSER